MCIEQLKKLCSQEKKTYDVTISQIIISVNRQSTASHTTHDYHDETISLILVMISSASASASATTTIIATVTTIYPIPSVSVAISPFAF